MTQQAPQIKMHQCQAAVKGEDTGKQSAGEFIGKRNITADTSLRLARFFGTIPQFWMGFQADYELDIAEDALGSRIEREVRISAIADKDEKGLYKTP